ncbi:MAG: hypothetical protein JW910_10145 [Anaerolineae bacterium]|nr:hypothetical protein [Anaerolineae bacterium]
MPAVILFVALALALTTWRRLVRELSPARQPVYALATRPDLALRRYPIPAHRAHRYARAADE